MLRNMYTVAVIVMALSWLQPLIGIPQTAAQSAAPGGFLELATSTTVRPSVTPVLPARGPFTFPAPYNTQGVRLTNASDCGGNDCLNYVGYSYWRNTNNHVGSNTMLIFVSLDRARGGSGPTLFSYDKLTDQVTKVGPVFDPSSPLSWATGEGWYWSPTQPTKLYVNSGPVLSRYDVNTRQLQTVFDVTAQLGSNRYIWQMHTSNDDKVHSATLRDSGTYAMLGCLVYSEYTGQFSYFPKTGDFDECQVDKSGNWLVIKEQVDGQHGEDNVIVNLQTGQQTIFYDQQGAAGHSDNGMGYMVAADNWYAQPGAVRVWSFDEPFPQSEPGVPPQGLLVYRTTDWSADVGHVSHANSKAGVPLDQQYACGSNASRLTLPRVNEIVCFRLDSTLQVLVVAPVMTDLNASGGGDDYAKMPKGNLDITGQYFIWTSNVGGNRLDAFVVKVPSQLLVSTSPTVSIASPASGASISGTVSVQVNATDDIGVASVSASVDSTSLGSMTSSPYAFSLDTTRFANGTHQLNAVATDTSGNTTNAAISVNIQNGGGGSASFSDDFNRLDSTVLGSGWTEVSGDLSIQSGVVKNAVVNGYHMAVQGTLSGTILTASADFARLSSVGGPRLGVVLRYKDSKNYYFIGRQVGGSSQLRMVRVLNGVETILRTANLPNPAVGAKFRITGRANGSTLSLDLDGVNRLSVTDSAFAAGSVGVQIGSPTSASTNWLDNFSATSQ